jgi:hypothetical protein
MANKRSSSPRGAPRCEWRSIPSPRLWIKLRHYNGKRDAEGSALVSWRGGGLGERDEVSGLVLDGELAHAVERGALGHDLLHVLHSG